ncbi:hypothetical protein OROMI_011504 [Orobanche minor]
MNVVATVQLQQTNFVHKASKRDELLGGNMIHAKARITIPRDPDLVTAHRAQRTRGTNSKDENVASTVRRFKALPLDRKVNLEAPSLLLKRSTPRILNFQEFHLKTSERVLQHSPASSKSAVPLNRSNKDSHVLTTNLTTDYGSREPGSENKQPDGDLSFAQVFAKLDTINKKLKSSEWLDGLDELVSGAKKYHGPGWLIGTHDPKCLKTSTQASAPAPTDSYVQELTKKIRQEVVVEVEAKLNQKVCAEVDGKINHKVQYNLTLVLKKLV